MRNKHQRHSGLLVLVALSCGESKNRIETARGPVAVSSTSTATSVPARNGCSYLTEAQASSALGQPSRYRLRQPTPAGCTIEPASGDVFHGTTVDFRVAQGTAQYDFLAAQKDADKITGLGDRAVWLGAGTTRGNLAVIRGNTAVLVTITDLSGHRQLEQKARDFARLVLEHL
ncbi:MAG TPA: hypothetical protein VFP39_07160 [Gemmatimonadales bacterium]|nr:hypothetical protein [Gemmatimonadales bacterium]